MMGPPAARLSNAGNPAPPTVAVRLDGALVKRVSVSEANTLDRLGWGVWRGNGRRRHLELTDAAPVSSVFGMRGKFGTRPMRADGRGQRAAGQLLGEPRSHLEPIPPAA